MDDNSLIASMVVVALWHTSWDSTGSFIHPPSWHASPSLPASLSLTAPPIPSALALRSDDATTANAALICWPAAKDVVERVHRLGLTFRAPGRGRRPRGYNKLPKAKGFATLQLQHIGNSITYVYTFSCSCWVFLVLGLRGACWNRENNKSEMGKAKAKPK